MDAAHIISGCHYFAGLSAAHRSALAGACVREAYGKGEMVFYEGQTVTGVYLVAEGCVQLVRMAPSGKEVVIKTCEPGEIFAEAALLKGGTYPVTANVVRESVLYLIPKADFLALLRVDSFRTDFEVGLMMRVRYLTERIAYLTAHEAGERLFHFLREHYGEKDSYRIAIAKKDIAAEIGVTPEALSRLIRRLAEDGTLKWQGDTVRLQEGFWHTYAEDV
jgi:CRP/FNR family transcriptional regulator